ncbi:MAG TPA: hypothetical protein DDZ80_22575 [Cyanobacteria bacterium UBA8803]|nr:hypothetical protein [Cyanobacteria bacterium UBA9273]HBL61112.1 hypothetical protein [Cyanobacteria bacterium UBA8803]
MVGVAVSRSGSGFEVVHVIEGRVRLRALGNNPRPSIDALMENLWQQEGIREISTNDNTSSLYISFDPDTLSLSELLEILHRCGVSGAGKSATEASKAVLPSETWLQASSRLQSFIPSLVGILTTRQLGFLGWQAIAVYLMTTSLTRQVMAQFDEEWPTQLNNKISQETAAELNGKLAPDQVTDTIQPRQVAYRIVHTIPGRIRLHIPEIAKDSDYAKRFQVLAKADTKITSFRVNETTASVVISYEPDLFTDAQITAHLVELMQAAGGGVTPPPSFEKGTRTNSISDRTNRPKLTQEESRPDEEMGRKEKEGSDGSNSLNFSSGHLKRTDLTWGESPTEVQDTVPSVSEPVQLSSQSVSEAASSREELAQRPSSDPASETEQRPEAITELPKQVIAQENRFWSCFKGSAIREMLNFLAKQPAVEA